jgi:serine/threonine protein kinase
VPSSIRPGDVLADRYRLVDLLTESGGGRFWRAHDRVLERHVALHVIKEDDERAAALLEAARRSATVHDRRLLRVLDADRADGLCYVINEWGSGDSLDIMLAAGPLGPRRAAWLVSEVAGAVAAGHAVGVCHGRLIPENVIVDNTGSVRLIGFAVDAAMHGLPPGRTSTDVADLGGLLYCALTGKWPGVSASALAEAPLVQGRVLRPRQVRAGIPRPLDTLCDEVVNPYSGPAGAKLREVHDIASAQGIADYLAAFVGDTAGLVEAEAAAGHRDITETVALPALPDPPPRDAVPEPAPEPDPEPDPEPEPDLEPTELPTQAGLPIFDDESDDVSWLDAPGDPAPPPPPFEEPPERPLFAPSPAGGRPERTPRPGTQTTPKPMPDLPPRSTPPPGGGGRSGFWPWDTGTSTGAIGAIDEPEEEVPGRSWLRLAAVIAAAILVLVAVVVAYNLGRGRTPLGAVPDDDTPSRAPSSQTPISPAADPITGVTATDFDPEGSPPEENPDLAPLAVDGDKATAWRSLNYKQNFGPGGLKSGVGLVLDLGADRTVTGVDITVLGGSTGLSLYLSDTAPTTVDGLTPVATATVDTTDRVELEQPTQGRFLTVWLTSVPATPDGFRGEVAEVTALG